MNIFNLSDRWSSRTSNWGWWSHCWLSCLLSHKIRMVRRMRLYSRWWRRSLFLLERVSRMRSSTAVVNGLVLDDRRGMDDGWSSGRSKATIPLQNMIDMSWMLRGVGSDLNMLPGWHSCINIKTWVKACVVRIRSQRVSWFVPTWLYISSR